MAQKGVKRRKKVCIGSTEPLFAITFYRSFYHACFGYFRTEQVVLYLVADTFGRKLMMILWDEHESEPELQTESVMADLSRSP